MGVRPPQQDDDDEPATVEFGIAALAARLDDAELTFPADREAIVRELGDPSVPIDASGRSVPLSAIVEELDQGRFDSQQELLNELHPVFEAYRERAAGGILSSLRALFPF